ncbi:SagB-type dehydrogenase domain-containing protein [Saccharopolyspora antimicrobica]|uniref:SagB-type dehydrogenase domain-containing protein n=1 Tax=Saccharopolyspora antimicrobica TaxID=455193 RepID=A0A1I5GY42_9PSEU|nr:SagB/ThcOx family dehydrogenase [Saccharopolyspora antimicrobica]RKT89255.1 SagB-type dehydrogenase family enzyme [Saccharopolyspora antimicrobica]SFO40857.1 SagB-type dehydrogenase domain-containing protein [Saccharopolyspora antimicrobica]
MAVENELVPLALHANSLSAATPWFNSTAYRPNQVRHSHLGFGEQARPAEEFLLASRSHRHDRETANSVADYLDEAFTSLIARTDAESVPDADRVDLPASLPLDRSLDELIQRRTSARSFSREPVDRAEIATLVRAAGGCTHPADSTRRVPGRAVPSAGGLFPVELHIVAIRVAGLDRGAYRFAPKPDAFDRYGDTTAVQALLSEGLGEFGENLPARDAACIALLVGRPWRSMRKYGARGLRFVLHEAGAMSEHLHLAANALGLASTDWAGFYDEPANRALGLDGLYRTLLHTVLIGRPDEA